jgi:transcriptional regulator with XRE-family HTH domain
VTVLFDFVSHWRGGLRLALSGNVRICEEPYGSRDRNAQGMPVSDSNLSDAQSRLIADHIREELARRRISRKGLAELAKISISTLEKTLSGSRPLTLATAIRLEEALGINLRDKPTTTTSPQGLAPGDLGYYSRPAVSWIEGTYLTLRPSFGDRDAIYAYRIEISWDDQSSSLAFCESERIDAAFTQAGTVSVPNQSGHIYLVTNRHGQYRLVIVSRPTISGEMHGILTTLRVGRGSQLTPVSTPVALVPVRSVKDLRFGQIRMQDSCYEQYREYLRRTVEDQFAVFLSP